MLKMSREFYYCDHPGRTTRFAVPTLTSCCSLGGLKERELKLHCEMDDNATDGDESGKGIGEGKTICVSGEYFEA